MINSNLSEHDLNLLWEYRNQQEDVLYGRINVFLIVQSMLFVAYTTSVGLIAGVIAYMGTVLTIVGLFVIRRQAFVFNFARKYLATEERLKAYRDLQCERQEKEDTYWFHRHFSGQELLCWSLPILMLVVWLALAINSIIPTIAGIGQDWIDKIAKERATSLSLCVLGGYLSFLFSKRNFHWPIKGKQIYLPMKVKQRLLAGLPLMVLLVWLGWGVFLALFLSGFKPMAWIGSYTHTLNYIAFGSVILLVVLLPAFRKKALKSKDSEQKSDNQAVAGSIRPM